MAPPVISDPPALLRAHGLRATRTRLRVLEQVAMLGQPASHDDVVTALAGAVRDRATIWRVLSDLVEVGILRRLDPGDRVWRYELAGSCQHQASHAHFLCEVCGIVDCLPPLEVRTTDGLPLPAVLRQQRPHLRLVGRCLSCDPLTP